MRTSENPIKSDYNIELLSYHRIVIPVYIPNFEGYFSEMFEVFKLCLESLLLTIHDKTRITLYNNNSCKEIKAYIDKKYEESVYIDQVFHSKENLGKINAILASVKGNLEPLITITDADVLFKNGWQQAVENLFIDFPEAGMISPVPSSKALRLGTANNWFYGFFRGKLKFAEVLDPHAMHLFDVSLGNKELKYKEIHLKKYLVIKNKSNNSECVMGCGHFVATLRREVFDKGSSHPALIKVANGVESQFIDNPNEELGYLRIATKENFAFHMGNNTESWMYEEFQKLSIQKYKVIDVNVLGNKPLKKWQTFIGSYIVRIVLYKHFKSFFLELLGFKNAKDY